MTNNQLGKFCIDRRLVDMEPGRVAEVFAMLKFVPVRCECLYVADKLEYVGISERFPEVPQGMMVPEYTLEITQSEAGNVELVEVKLYR